MADVHCHHPNPARPQHVPKPTNARTLPSTVGFLLNITTPRLQDQTTTTTQQQQKQKVVGPTKLDQQSSRAGRNVIPKAIPKATYTAPTQTSKQNPPPTQTTPKTTQSTTDQWQETTTPVSVGEISATPYQHKPAMRPRFTQRIGKRLQRIVDRDQKKHCERIRRSR